MRRRILLGVVVLALAPAAGAAQETILLRYRPAAQAMTRTVSNTVIDARLWLTDGAGVDRPAGVAGDSIAFQARAQLSFTDRVLQARDRYLVERTLDSIRMGVNMMTMPVRENTDLRPRRAHLLLDDRLQIVEFQMRGEESAGARADQLRSPLGGFEFTLPAEPVGPGDPWSTALRFPFTLPIQDAEAPGALAIDTVMTADAMFRLDSLVARGRDTLAYLSTWGQFDPFTMAVETGDGRGSGVVTGGFAGVVIWSTAWNAFGSGAIRSELEMRFTASEGGQRGSGSAAFDIVTRFEIRS